MELMKKVTNRGFSYYEFEDKANSKCILQESSYAGGYGDDSARIWFGIENPSISAFIPGGGHIDFEPPNIKFDNNYGDGNVTATVNSRMLLSQTQVRQLLPILQKFVETGTF